MDSAKYRFVLCLSANVLDMICLIILFLLLFVSHFVSFCTFATLFFSTALIVKAMLLFQQFCLILVVLAHFPPASAHFNLPSKSASTTFFFKNYKRQNTTNYVMIYYSNLNPLNQLQHRPRANISIFCDDLSI